MLTPRAAMTVLGHRSRAAGQGRAGARPPPDRGSLRLAATLLTVGELVALVVGAFHPGREDPNNHPAVFAEYAASTGWTAVHLGQFAGMALVSAGLLALFVALDPRAPRPGWASGFGAVAAVAALALYGVLQAVDGVALKQAVDAWARAPEADKAARFATAEAVRWLEWAVRSYHSFLFGLALVLLAAALAGTPRVPRPLGYLMGLSGVAYLVQGWVLGAEGFSAANTAPQLLGYLLTVAWSLWLLVVAWRMPRSGEAAPG
jgi:Domain of unknown function (DUF4386)